MYVEYADTDIELINVVNKTMCCYRFLQKKRQIDILKSEFISYIRLTLEMRTNILKALVNY